MKGDTRSSFGHFAIAFSSRASKVHLYNSTTALVTAKIDAKGKTRRPRSQRELSLLSVVREAWRTMASGGVPVDEDSGPRKFLVMAPPQPDW